MVWFVPVPEPKMMKKYEATMRCFVCDEPGTEFGNLLITQAHSNDEIQEMLEGGREKMSVLYGGYFRRTAAMDDKNESVREAAYEDLVNPIVRHICTSALEVLGVLRHTRKIGDRDVHVETNSMISHVRPSQMDNSLDIGMTKSPRAIISLTRSKPKP